MRSVKIKESQGDVVKDLKKYLKEKEGISTTEAEILTRAVGLAVGKHYDELVEKLKSSDEEKDKSILNFVLENPKKGKKTNAAEDHDAVGL